MKQEHVFLENIYIFEVILFSSHMSFRPEFLKWKNKRTNKKHRKTHRNEITTSNLPHLYSLWREQYNSPSVLLTRITVTFVRKLWELLFLSCLFNVFNNSFDIFLVEHFEFVLSRNGTKLEGKKSEYSAVQCWIASIKHISMQKT